MKFCSYVVNGTQCGEQIFPLTDKSVPGERSFNPDGAEKGAVPGYDKPVTYHPASHPFMENPETLCPRHRKLEEERKAKRWPNP